MFGVNNSSVCVVTVTYGNRKDLLLQMVEGVHVQGVTRFVVVNNGAQWGVDGLRAIFSSLDVEVVDMGANRGSAEGFGAGIKRALDRGAEFIWLMDDDNMPHAQCLQALFDVYEQEQVATPRDSLAVLAFRPEHQADVAAGVSEERINPRPNSFRGFHLLDIPFKIWRRTPWGRPQQLDEMPRTILVHEGPYSGLLFHRSLIHSIGLPNPDFVLYADDNEFTYRITQRGGRILLVTSARIDDLEASWSIKGRFANSFAAQLCGIGDFRAFYGMRNGVYFDTISRKRNSVFFWINRTLYMILLFMFSCLYKKPERYRILCEAVRDGLACRLGFHTRFPL